MTDSHLRIRIDRQRNIVHVTADKLVRVSSEKMLEEVCGEVATFLSEQLEGRRCYLVVNISRIQIDDDLHEVYARHVEGMMADCIIPGGLVRYGYGITRLTAIEGHRHMSEKDPHLFATEQEAFVYIDSLIAQQTSDPVEPDG